MSSAYGFFNAQLVDGNYDRAYGADELSEFFDKFIGSGICEEPDSFLVTPNGSMEITVHPGFCWVKGHYFKIVDDEALSLDIGPTSGSRIDAIVIRLSNSDRNVVVAVAKGTASMTPVAPDPIRNSDVYELVVAHIAVSANMSTVTQSSITDKRSDTALCGFINPFAARMIPDGSVTAEKLNPGLVLPISKGGTGGSTSADARNNLGVTPENIGAKPSTQIESIAKGGTGANNAASARENLGITPENINALKTGIIYEGDIISVTYPGSYRVRETATGFPPGAIPNGQLLVVRGNPSDTLMQFYLDYETNSIYTRGAKWLDFPGVTPAWTSWKKLVDASGAQITGSLDIVQNVTVHGKLILDSESYGDALPAAGTPGRVFFVKVSQ